MKYRARFIKGDNVKFVGHLDLMRAIQRTLNRASLGVKYSEGFNPHQVLSIAQPIAVGQISCGEYMDFELMEDIKAEIIKDKFNSNAPEGIMIDEVRGLENGEKKVASLVEYGKYKVCLDKNISKSSIDNFMDQEKIEATKEGKSGPKVVDIRKDIIEISVEENILHCIISTGSTQNLKVELLVKTLYEFVNLEYDEDKLDIERLDLFYMKEGKLENLMN